MTLFQSPYFWAVILLIGLVWFLLSKRNKKSLRVLIAIEINGFGDGGIKITEIKVCLQRKGVKIDLAQLSAMIVEMELSYLLKEAKGGSKYLLTEEGKKLLPKPKKAPKTTIVPTFNESEFREKK